MEIAVDDLNKDNGMDTLLVKLDSLFLKEEKDPAYEADLNFDQIKRDCSVPITDYIIDFDRGASQRGLQRINKRHLNLAKIHWTSSAADRGVLFVNLHFNGPRTVHTKMNKSS